MNTDAINAYPNPTKGPFELQLKGFTSLEAEVSIFNGEGKMVQKRQLNGAGTNTVDFDLTGQAKGVYYIKIRARVEQELRRFCFNSFCSIPVISNKKSWFK